MPMYDCIEVFGGVGSVASAFNNGFVYDVRRGEHHNIHHEGGLKILAEQMVLTKPGGLVMVEPTCSSFLRFVSTHTSKRTQDFGLEQVFVLKLTKVRYTQDVQFEMPIIINIIMSRFTLGHSNNTYKET